MRRCSADDRAFSAWLICLMPSGPVALTFTAWLRAWITASSVDRSNSMAPLTAFTRLGIRSWRRLSWTSICLNAFSVWFLREMSPLYAPTSHATTTTRTTSKMSGPIDRKSTRLNSSHSQTPYAVFCLKKSYAAFARLPATIAEDGSMHRQFSFRGDRLSRSLRIVVLGVGAPSLCVRLLAHSPLLIPL